MGLMGAFLWGFIVMRIGIDGASHSIMCSKLT